MRHPLVKKILEQIELQIVGKTQEITLVLTAFFAKGHVLVEDLPGMGKTSTAKALARALNLKFGRIQGSTDLLPSDILGVNVFNPQTRGFEFQEGPVFTEVLLFDEMNRTPPKTQSALLQCMAERQVTIDQNTMALPWPFFVIGTQNPASSEGTYKLPDSQLDRFSIRLSLGYPGRASEKSILAGELSDGGTGGVSREEILQVHEDSKKVHVEDRILEYVLDIVEKTRSDSRLIHGVSVRGSQEIVALSRVAALLDGRDFVVPEDIKSLAPAVFSHRILSYEYSDQHSQESYIYDVLTKVSIPL